MSQKSIPPASDHRQAADPARRGRTLQRGVIDDTPDDHGNKQNRQAGNAWHADCLHEGCQAVTTASEALRGVCVGLERFFF